MARKKDSKKREEKAVENLVNPSLKVDRKAQREFILQALQDRQDKFLELLDAAAKSDPVLYLRLYLEFSKIVVPKNSDVNVNLSLNRDFMELKALSNGGVRSIGSSSRPSIGSVDLSGIEDVEFEEIGVMPFESAEEGLRKIEEEIKDEKLKIKD